MYENILLWDTLGCINIQTSKKYGILLTAKKYHYNVIMIFIVCVRRLLRPPYGQILDPSLPKDVSAPSEA
jgi:hypothetical protein